MEHQQKLSSQLYYFRKDRYIYMELKFVIPNMEKTFGNLEFAGEDKIEQRRINGRMAVLSRSFNLYSDVQRADDIVVILPAEAGEKHFDFEEQMCIRDRVPCLTRQFPVRNHRKSRCSPAARTALRL